VADEERSASSKGVDRRIDIQPAEDEDGKKTSRSTEIVFNWQTSCRSRRRTVRKAYCVFPLLAQPPSDQRDLLRRGRARRALRGHHRAHAGAQEAGAVAHDASEKTGGRTATDRGEI
jgi:hypothetical protein